MSKTAHIVAIATSSLGDLGFGISAHPGDVDHIFEQGQVWIGPRPILEENTDFVQPIPYIVVRRGNKVLAYTRSSKGGEGRLHNKVSIGFGGHVDAKDIVVDHKGVINLRDTMFTACSRELEEELDLYVNDLTLAKVMEFTHVIQSQATPVDSVHIGLVGVLDLYSLGQFQIEFEDSIENASFVDIEWLKNPNLDLETWTGLLAGIDVWPRLRNG